MQGNSYPWINIQDYLIRSLKMRSFMLSLICCLLMCFMPCICEAIPVSITVQDAPVRSVLSSLAKSCGQSIVMDGSVKGNISVSITDVDSDEAFRLIADAGGLLVEKHGDVLVLRGSTSEGARSMHVFPLSYASAGSICDAMIACHSDTSKPIEENGKKSQAKQRKEDVRFFADKESNSVLFYGTDAEAAEAGRVIKRLDVPSKQVSLEAKVVAIDESAAKELGVDWEWSKLPQYPDVDEEYDSVRKKVQNADGSWSYVWEDIPRRSIDRHNGENGTPGVIQFGRGPEGYPFEFYYAAKISALITGGKARMLARPNIMTIQGHEASINIGGEVPVPRTSITDSTQTTSYEYKPAGIILRYTPIVNDNGQITARVHTEVSSPLYVDTMKAYRFQKREADTVVRLRDGETMVIGGLIGSDESRALSKVPFLGDMPILGNFFKSIKRSKSDSEIMIFLTAHIVNDSTK